MSFIFVHMSSETHQASFRYLFLQLTYKHLFVGNMVLMAISTLIIMRMILTKQSWHSLFKSKWAGRKSRGLEGEWAGRKSRFTNKRARGLLHSAHVTDVIIKILFCF